MSWLPAVVTLGGELIALAPHLLEMRKAFKEQRYADSLAALDATRVDLERLIVKRRRGG